MVQFRIVQLRESLASQRTRVCERVDIRFTPAFRASSSNSFANNSVSLLMPHSLLLHENPFVRSTYSLQKSFPFDFDFSDDGKKKGRQPIKF